VSGLAAAISFTGSGYFNFASHEGDVTFAMSGLPAAAQSTLHGDSLRMIELFKGGTLYIGSPLFAGLAGGRRWVRLDLARVGQALGLDPGSLTSGGSNPAEYLRYLTAAGATSSVVGHEQVRGVATTHYAGSLDLLKLAETQPGANRAQVRAALQRLIAQTGQHTVAVEVWVDAQHLVRRFALTLDADSAGTHVSTTIRADYYDFGPTPAIRTPADSEVLDITGQALARMPGAGG
jgi:hypothetical protein